MSRSECSAQYPSLGAWRANGDWLLETRVLQRPHLNAAFQVQGHPLVLESPVCLRLAILRWWDIP